MITTITTITKIQKIYFWPHNEPHMHGATSVSDIKVDTAHIDGKAYTDGPIYWFTRNLDKAASISFASQLQSKDGKYSCDIQSPSFLSAPTNCQGSTCALAPTPFCGSTVENMTAAIRRRL